MGRVAASARVWSCFLAMGPDWEAPPTARSTTIPDEEITKVADAVLANSADQVQAHYRPHTDQTSLY
jgi:hypothetical protein